MLFTIWRAVQTCPSLSLEGRRMSPFTCCCVKSLLPKHIGNLFFHCKRASCTGREWVWCDFERLIHLQATWRWSTLPTWCWMITREVMTVPMAPIFRILIGCRSLQCNEIRWNRFSPSATRSSAPVPKCFTLQLTSGLEQSTWSNAGWTLSVKVEPMKRPFSVAAVSTEASLFDGWSSFSLL